MSFKEYAAELQRNLKSGQATEPSYYPALKSLIESLDSSVSVLQNPAKTECGLPDFRLSRKRTIEFPVGLIEAKAPGEDLNKIERSEQLKRYLSQPNVILTDFLEFRWYTDGKVRRKASLGALADGKCKFDAAGQAQVEELLRGFLQYGIPPAENSRQLAIRMAGIAHFIRGAILDAYGSEAPHGILHQQMDAFREALIPDLDATQFADMYAQTIAYGLFAARCQPAATPQKFSRDSAARFIPKTNPFLQKLFYVIAGPDLPEQILPYVDDLVALLRDTDIGAIMADFGKRTAKEDPVVHFYEDFLQAYDPKLRELRGVYYTPEPVVSYIVRSIDHILKTEFAKPMGLADKDVLILDPACGTGTFLYYVIRHIYDTLCEHGQKGQWNSYVSENLLKRIFGFELLMAPYAVAHLKLGLQLQELGYKFESDERLGVYLTNTLEEAAKKAQHLFAFADAIAEEARLAGDVKLNKKVMVVLGNPPYSGHSTNRSWEIRIDAKTKKPKKVPTFIGNLLQDYYKVDGQPLGEKNPKWLQDDYVKFIRFAQWRINRTGYGVLGFITNHGYLDNPTFRGMRQQLLHNFSEIHILDLHGNSKKKERVPDGSADENVFDIQQGVAIGILTKPMASRAMPILHHAHLWGERASKYHYLPETDISKTSWQELHPTAPSYLFIPRGTTLQREYEDGLSLHESMLVNVLGFQTHRDSVAVGFTEEELRKQVSDYLGVAPSKADWERYCRRCSYRPFDKRWVYLGKEVTDRPRLEVMQELFRENVSLNLLRQTRAKEWCHALVSRDPTPAIFLEIKDGSSVFPLYCYHDPYDRLKLKEGESWIPLLPWTESSQGRRPNFNRTIIGHFEILSGLQFLTEGSGDMQQSFGPDDVLSYAYAILYSPTYRSRYVEFLKSDFPRLPATGDKAIFKSLARKGGELVSLHLMESPKLANFITRYEQPGDHTVEKVRYIEPNPKAGIKAGRVYINGAQYFDGVPKEVWEFQIGGYQVCEKWLKDRKGRKLSSDDIDHYQKIVVALAETIRLMREIDEIIPAWPLP